MQTTDDHALQEEIAHLRQRNAELERAVADKHYRWWMQRAFVDAPIALVIGDERQRTVQISNRAFQALLGYPADILEGMPFARFTHPDDVAIEQPLLEELVAGKRASYEIEQRYRCKDGQTRWVHRRVSLLTFSESDPALPMSSVEDITEQREASQTLQDKQALLEQVLNALPANIVAKTIDGTILFVNRAFAASVGLPPEALIGNDQQDLFPPNVIAAWDGVEQQVLESGDIVTFEERQPHPSGDGLQTFTSSKFPLYSRNGSRWIYGFGAISMDITNLKHAEEEVGRSQTLLEGVIENSSLVVIVKSREGRYLFMSRLAASILHTIPAQIIGKTDTDLFPPETAAHLRAMDQHVIEAGSPLSSEELLPLPDGICTYLLVKFPLSDASGHVYAVGIVGSDISELKRLEAERLAFQEEIIAAQKMAISELSTPLMPIAPGIIAVPLIGKMDPRRAQQVMETLLAGVSTHRANMAILDVTGLGEIDAQTTDALVKTVRAVTLLGVHVIVTGIQPHIAQTLVQLGVSGALNDIVSRSTLQAGIAYALERQKRRARRA